MLLQQQSPGAGQNMPGVDAEGSASSSAAQASSSNPAQQFAARTLASLLSLQEQPPSSSDLANQLISHLDSDGDGSLSSGEIQSALGNSGTHDISQAMSKLDTNGDGKLDAGEIAAGLDSARAARHGHHGHRHEIESANDSGSTGAAPQIIATNAAEPGATATAPIAGATNAAAVTTAVDVDAALAALAA